MQPAAAARVQARDEARAEPQAHRELHRRAEGGLLPLEEEPAEGAEASAQEVVLHAHAGVGAHRPGQPQPAAEDHPAAAGTH